MKRTTTRRASRLSRTEEACLSFVAGRRDSLSVSDPAWHSEIERLAVEHLTPLAERILRADPDEAPDPILVDRYHRHARALAVRTLAVEAAAAPFLARLAMDGVPFVVIKGPAVAQFYRFPADRPYTDIDVLIPPRHFRAVCRTAWLSGYFREASELQPWRFFDRACLEGVNFHGPGLANIDIHHHLAPWALTSLLSATDLIARSQQGFVLTAPVRFASAEDSLIVAALHMLSDLWKQQSSAVSLCDFMTLQGRIHPTTARIVFADAGLAWLYDLTTSQVAHLSGPDGPEVRSTRPSARTRLRLRLLGWYGPVVKVRHPASWLFRLPILRALLFAVGSLVPSPTYVRDKHGSYFRYWWTGLRSLR